MCSSATYSSLYVPGLKEVIYRKNPKYSDTRNICCNHPKIWTWLLYRRLIGPKDADRMANSWAVWSGSTLFAQAYLSENLRSLRYILFFYIIHLMDRMNHIASERHEIWNILSWNERISDSLTYFKKKVGDNGCHIIPFEPGHEK